MRHAANVWILTALLAVPAAADIGPKPRTWAGGLTVPRELAGLEIEMSAEEVVLTLAATGEARHERLRVDATFHLTNLGAAVEIEEGFPVGPLPSMKSFGVTIDGAPADFELVDLAPPSKETGRRGARAGDWWYLWRAHFPAGAKRVHRVRYEIDLHHRNLSQIETGYVLHTGAPWKNAIGRAKVTLRLEGLPADRVYALSPAQGLSRSGDAWSWEIADLEPTREHDVRIRYGSEQSWEDAVGELRARADESFAASRLVERLLEGPSRHGRARLTPEEAAAACAAIDGLLARAEKRGDAFELPATEAGDKKSPWSRGDADFLLDPYPALVRAARADATHAGLRAALARWTEIAEAFRAGRLRCGDRVLTLRVNAAVLGPEVDAAVVAARELLASPPAR